MKAIFASDIHANKSHLGSLVRACIKHKADKLIIGGDIIPKDLGSIDLIDAQWRYLSEVFEPAIIELRTELPGLRVYLDMGNDDLICNRTVLERMHEYELISLLHMKKSKLADGLDIIGYMNVPITPFSLKDWERKDTRATVSAVSGAKLLGYKSLGCVMRQWYLDVDSDTSIEDDLKRLSETIDRPFVFISHAPPFDTALDMLDSGVHAGSVAVRDFILKWAEDGRLLASFHGHIHESPSVSCSIDSELGGVSCYNPGQNDSEDLRYIVFDPTDFTRPPKLYEGF